MKKIIILFLTFFVSISCVYAEKIPVRITPTQIISTVHDEIQLGDWVDFEIMNDVYADGKMYLKKGTLIIGVVDFVHENGWVKDKAEIRFKTFYTKDINDKKVEIDYPLALTQKILVKNNVKKLTFQEIESLIRGQEIYIEPDTVFFNIFIER